jgi:SpoVK/Ycf46/Vps4 family AAA+-type ATPase
MPPENQSVFNKGEEIEPPEEDKFKDKKRERLYIPLTLYYVKDLLREFVNNKYFPDSVLSVFAMISVAIAFPFYPLIILVPLIIIVFVLSRLLPLVGFMGLLFFTFPMFVYQAPLLGWIYLLFLSAALFFGYRNTDTLTVSYALIMLPFSYLGYLMEIPVFIMGILFLGFKRGLIVVIIALLLIPMLSGLTGIHNTAPIMYNQAAFRASVGNSSIISFLTPSSEAATLGGFPAAFSKAFGSFLSWQVAGDIFQGGWLGIQAIAYSFEITAVQLAIWLIVVFAVINQVTKSRSGYKGTEAGLYCAIIFIAYLLLTYASGTQLNLLVLSGFVITPPLIFILEMNDVSIVRALDMMKKDFIGKFGEAFEDLTTGTRETLNDIGDYVETKKELTEALLEPIEHKEIVGAYNIRPAKGILLFGPPGTGKTLIMRALSNEIRARFFYVKTSSVVSPYAGESIQMLSKIFAMAKKHPPAVLFFDEIDGIAGKRENQQDENARQLLSMLLAEMDGFQKLEGIVVVGSTNVPQMLDPGIMRPGRFDKIIYMPLPDRTARIAVFEYYSKKYPMSSDIDFEKLADMTERFSNADIANVCAEAARHVAEVALKKAQILKIDTDDLMRVIKGIKPSTSISRIAEYEKFKLDYERRNYQESETENKKKVTVDDVVGLEEAKKALYEALEIPILHPHLAKEYDVKSINGILMLGPPGTGKTMLMTAIANELGEYKMIKLSGVDLVKEGYEKAVATINEVFNRAKESAPAIIFIDEIDSLVPKRDTGELSDIQITAEFLKEFDSLKDSDGVILVGATNRPEAIDLAMIRPGRFDKLIFVGGPSKEDRVLLFKRGFEKAPCEQLDFDKLAGLTEGYTGADIVNICNDVKMDALESKIKSKNDQKIKTEDVMAVIKETKSSAPDSVLNRYKLFISLHGRK